MIHDNLVVKGEYAKEDVLRCRDCESVKLEGRGGTQRHAESLACVSVPAEWSRSAEYSLGHVGERNLSIISGC